MFSGAVLCGGASSRMGADKAFVEVGDRSLVVRVAGALQAAGADEVLCIGGDIERLRSLGLEAHADDQPGEGPLGAIATALRRSRNDVTVVLACDLIHPSPAAIATVVEALTGVPSERDTAPSVAVPVVGGRAQWLHAAWRADALELLERAFADGVRAIHRAAAGLSVLEVPGIAVEAVVDADTPGDLPECR